MNLTKTTTLNALLALVMGALIVVGCVEATGTGQTTDPAKTGVILAITEFSHPTVVDAHWILDCDGDASTDDPEPNPFFDSFATLKFESFDGPGGTTPPDVFLTEYEIEYVSDDPDAPDINVDPTGGVFAHSLAWNMLWPVSSGGTFEAGAVEVVPLEVKNRWNYYIFVAPATGSLVTNYTAIVTFRGETTFGEEIELVWRFSFNMGAYDFCG